MAQGRFLCQHRPQPISFLPAMKVPAISQLIRLRKTTPLSEQVTRLRICPECHSRTLVETARDLPDDKATDSTGQDSHWLQCRRCHKIFLADSPKGKA
jgi:uncharacterized protein with PIN domain